MGRRGRWILPWLLPLVLAGGRGPAARAGEPPATASDFVAPRGCWGVADGCAARTGASATPSLRGSVVEAWSWTVPADPGGEIEEEPRVWHDRVYVCVRAASGRFLYALGTADGQQLLPPLALTASEPLDPCVTEMGVLLRSRWNELRIVRPVDGRWATVWGPVTVDGRLEAPLLANGMLCASSERGLEWWEPPSTKRRSFVAATLRGRTAIAQRRAWLVDYDEAGGGHLRGTWPTGGDIRGPFLGHHGTRGAPRGASSTRIAVGPTVTIVDHGTPVRTGTGTARTSIARAGESKAGLFDFVGLPAIVGDRWVGYGEEKGTTRLRLTEPAAAGELRWWNLAGSGDRPEFYRPGLPITLAQGVAWVGTSAFDVATRRVTCRLPDARALFRVVPAEGRLLVVPEATRVVAWREESAAPEKPVLLGPAYEGQAAALTGIEGKALFRDDTLHVGVYDLDPASGTVALRMGKNKPLKRPLAEVLVLTQGTDRLLYVASLTWLERHLARLSAFDRRDEALKLVRSAVASQDADLLEATLSEALARGVIEKDVAFAERALTALRERPLKVYESKQKEVATKLAWLQAPRPVETLALLSSGLQDPRPHVQRALLRLVLERKPDHAEAVAIVRGSLPAHVRVPEPFVAKDWIDVRTAFAAIPTKPVDVPPEGSRALTPGERELGAARHYWRKDLVGVESPQLLVMTSLNAPDRLATCLSLGELVCTALEDVFASGEHVRKGRWPLILQLFETEAEYRAHHAGELEPHDIRVWSGGHYDPEAGLSRIFVPAGDENLEDVRQIYVHELTHHWIQERCPLFEARDAKATKSSVTWIVEGMAVLVESFQFNVPERRWETFVPGVRLLDEGAHGPERADWRSFFDVTYSQFQRLDREYKHTVVLRSELGSEVKTSDLRAFYASAGTVCQFLFHKGARERAALLAYVRDAYTGKVRAGTEHIAEHFGLSPQELGRAAVDWARGVTEGRIQRKDVFVK